MKKTPVKSDVIPIAAVTASRHHRHLPRRHSGTDAAAFPPTNAAAFPPPSPSFSKRLAASGTLQMSEEHFQSSLGFISSEDHSVHPGC